MMHAIGYAAGYLAAIASLGGAAFAIRYGWDAAARRRRKDSN